VAYLFKPPTIRSIPSKPRQGHADTRLACLGPSPLASERTAAFTAGVAGVQRIFGMLSPSFGG